MKKVLLSVLAIALSTTMFAQSISLQEKWRLGGFEAPESVAYDPSAKALYVSNVNGNPGEKDGNGYISKVSLEGKILEKEWIKGLNAPKGLTISNKKLYVTDITEIVEIDINAGKILNRYPAMGATFLNDICADEQGNVYASNTFGGESIIFKLADGKVTQWINDKALRMPNGITVYNKHLYVASWGEGEFNPNTFQTEMLGSFLKIDLKDKKIEMIHANVGNLDGIVKTALGVILTDWIQGKILYISHDKKDQVQEVLQVKQGSADITADNKLENLYVPQMMNGEVVAYSIKK